MSSSGDVWTGHEGGEIFGDGEDLSDDARRAGGRQAPERTLLCWAGGSRRPARLLMAEDCLRPKLSNCVLPSPFDCRNEVGRYHNQAALQTDRAFAKRSDPATPAAE